MLVFDISRYVVNLKKQLPYIPKTLKLIKQASGNLLYWWLIINLIQGILPAIFIYTIRPLVNKLTHINNIPITIFFLIKTYPEIVVITLIILLTESLKSIIKWIRIYQGELVQDHIKSLIHNQSLKLDLGFFEHSEYYNKLYQAKIDSLSKPLALLENLGLFIQNMITITAIIVLLIAYKWWVAPVIIISTLPLFFILFYHTAKFHEWRVKATVMERKALYYDFLLTERESAAEVRLFNLGNYFKNIFKVTRSELRNQYYEINKKQMIFELIGITLGLIISGLIMFYMLKQTLEGLISFGVLTMFYISFNQCQKSMSSMVYNITEVYRNITFIQNLFEFLEMKPLILPIGENQISKFEIKNSIKFKNVKFSYPFNQRNALENFNLEIKANKITAIVGTNGAGKSTIIKLLCRFYDPNEGSIEIDGINLKNYSPLIIHKNMTVLFQDFVKYHASAKENIGLGNTENSNFGTIKEAAFKSGADISINKLPDKYDNMLGRWFAGAELSGGEWQRVALARAFFRQSELIVLDEPTSAMDSWAESDWLERFKNLVKNKTSIIITHRFTTAMQADIIYVVDKGIVIEKGNHNELMDINGEYAKSWLIQTKQINYKN